MKIIIFVMALVASNAMAIDIGAAKGLGSKALEKGKEVAAACKHEQVEFCKEYKEVKAIKECLIKNKEKLSPACKASLGHP